MKVVKVADISIGEGTLALIAGPCVIETPEGCLSIARETKRIADEAGFPLIFKASFDKANRTSVRSFRGPGLEDGLKVLKRVKDELGLPVLTDVHESWQVERVAKVVEVLQIPAFLCRQTDLLVAAGRTGKPVNVKKGQFLAPQEVKHIIDKIVATGNEHILLTERGTSFGYQNLVVDMRSLPIMRKFGYPVVFDATHSLQLPGAGDGASGGLREFIPTLLRSAVAAGVDAIFMEVHNDPPSALSDAATMVPLSQLSDLLRQVKRIHQAVKEEQCR